jgi:predicted HTH domain antitoxin
MQVVNVRQLKTNPSVALRMAKQELVVITHRDKPDAVLISMEELGGVPNLEQVRLVMAISLFKGRQLSIGASARFAGKPLGEMISILSSMGVAVVDYSPAEIPDELNTLSQWLAAPGV